MTCFINSHVCNFADNTSLNVFSKDIHELLHNLEYDTQSAIIWFKNNFMKLNQDKCHFMVAGNINEHLYAKVGDKMMWKSTG